MCKRDLQGVRWCSCLLTKPHTYWICVMCRRPSHRQVRWRQEPPCSYNSVCWEIEGPCAHRPPERSGMLSMQNCPLEGKDLEPVFPSRR